MFDKLFEGLFGFAGGPNDPRLTPQANQGAARSALINAGLQTLMSADAPGLAGIASGIAAGRQSGAAARSDALTRQNQEAMAGLLKSGEMDMRMLERVFGQAIANGDFDTVRAISPILSAAVSASGRNAPNLNISYQTIVGEDGKPRRIQIVTDPTSGALMSQRDVGPAPETSPIVSMDTRQESAMNQAFGTGAGTDMSDVMAAGRRAQADLVRFEEMGRLLNEPGVYEGTAANAILRIRQLGAAIGLPLEGVGDAEAARALMVEQALRTRANPETLLTGATSDQDFTRLLSTGPQLANTPEGNKLLLEILQTAAQRKVEESRAVRRYIQQNGGIDVGVYDAIEQAVNSVDFSDLARRADSALGNPYMPPAGG